MAWLLKCFNAVKFLALVAFVLTSLSQSGEAAELFPRKKITVANKTLVVEVAETAEQHERGLMFRTKLGEDDGMLFIFNNEQTRFFWMKNTLIDLSIGYFDKKGVLIDVKEMKSGKGIADAQLPSYPSAKPAKYALEMNKGWFDRNKVTIGSKLKVH